MVNVDIKRLLKRLNTFSTQALEGAAGLCVSRTHYEVTVEHLLLRLVEATGADCQRILRHFDISPERVIASLQADLETLKSGNPGRPVFSPLLLEWIQEAWLTGSVDLELNEVRSGVLLLALAQRPGRFLTGETLRIIEALRPEDMERSFFSLVEGSSESAPGLAEGGAEGPERRPAGETALGKFCIDFTEQAKEGKIDPVFGRDREIRQMVDILTRRRKNNPIVVGEAGVGKTAVVEGLALRVAEGDVPDVLQGVKILGLDLGLLQAGAGMKGEFEKRLKSVIDEVKASPVPIILFIDEAHTLIGAGGSAGGSDAANLLKPALARGELRTVAATTWSEYKKYFEKDAALARRFQLVKLDEPSPEDTVVMLRGLKPKYEAAHGVVVRNDAVEACAHLSNRYISGRQLPDKAVDLLDTSCARVRINLSSRPDVLEDLTREKEALERELKALLRDRDQGIPVDEERIEAVKARMEEIEKETKEVEAKWVSEKAIVDEIMSLRAELQEESEEKDEAKRQEAREKYQAKRLELQELQGKTPLIRTEVDPDVVAKVVADWTGIPVGKMLRDEAQIVLQLEENLKQRIKGQDHALSAIAQVLKAAKAGLTNPKAPLGVFLLVGPSGTGKTETGLSLADLLFGGERFMVTINMSEFQEKHTVSRLIGSPPGYVGYGEGGVLTEAVRQRPYSVVLLDEVEKADLEVMNLFYQVFDKGTLSDGEGRVIDFKNTVIFLTSNLASDVITQVCMGEERPSPEELMSMIRPILSNHFKPALLARMNVIPFYPLGTDVLAEIVRLKLDKIKGRLESAHKIHLTYADEVVSQIAARCTEVETGARNIDYILQGTLLPQISSQILKGIGEGVLPPEVHIGLKEDGNFDVTFKGES